MRVVIRPFERRDRDQLTVLVNLHVAAVIPGVVLSVNAVLGQLEREPEENIIDPWVAERLCLVAERRDGIVAATLLHRFRDEVDVGEHYRGIGDIRWLVCQVDALEAGAQLVRAALVQMAAWQVRLVSADCSLPARACYGVPDTLPHIRGLLSDAGFGKPARAELVLWARCDALTGHRLPDARMTRTLGLLGARLTLYSEGRELGFIEICDQPAGMARSSVAVRWADVGNLILADGVDADATVPALLSAGAEWLLLGGNTRLLYYWAEDVDPPGQLDNSDTLGLRSSSITSVGSNGWLRLHRRGGHAELSVCRAGRRGPRWPARSPPPRPAADGSTLSSGSASPPGRSGKASSPGAAMTAADPASRPRSPEESVLSVDYRPVESKRVGAEAAAIQPTEPRDRRHPHAVGLDGDGPRRPDVLRPDVPAGL